MPRFSAGRTPQVFSRLFFQIRSRSAPSVLLIAVLFFSGCQLRQAAPLTENCPAPPAGMTCVPGGPSVIGRDGADTGETWPQPSATDYQGYHSPSLHAKETPRININISTFYIDINEVTSEEFDRCVKTGFCKRHPHYDNHLYNGFREAKQPAVPVNWEQANAYCRWAGKRLPTEAEWEKAARGPQGEDFPWGNAAPTCQLANYQRCRPTTAPVGSYPAGRYGIFDMAGNGYEWTNDWASACREGCPDACGDACKGRDPQGPCVGKYPCANLSRKVMKGGSWFWPAEHASPVWRRVEEVQSGGNRISFRCASSTPVLTRGPGWMISSRPPVPPEPSQPDEASLKLLHDIEYDRLAKPLCAEIGWSPADCKDPTSYVVTNERDQSLFAPYIQNLSGGYAGVAADANYTFIAYARSEYVWLFDFDITIVRLHLLLKALIKASASPEDLVRLLAPGAQQEALAILEKEHAGNPDLGEIKKVLLRYRDQLYGNYGSRLAAAGAPFSWLSSADAYRYVRLLYTQNRISIHEGDLMGTKTVRAIGQSARNLRVPIRVFYPSDAETHWAFVDNYRTNMQSLFYDEKSVIIRTIWQGYFSPFAVKYHWQEPRQGVFWHYLVMPGLHYQKYIGLKEYESMDDFKYMRRPTDFFNLSVIALPDSIP